MKNLNKFQRKAVSNVEEYYKGSLIIKYNLNPIKINKSKIDWKYNDENNSRTYQVYLHSLPFIRDFTVAGSVMKKSSYFKEAHDLILDWYKSDEIDTLKWNEHAVSSRIKNIIYFQERNHKYKIEPELYNKIIHEHCEYLSDESNYKRNNHGLMMDNALIYSASVLSDEKLKRIYLEKALYRIRFALYRDFSRKGVHLENSPEYHRLVLVLYRKLEESLSRHDVKLDKDINLMIENAKNYNKYILKPNLTYPLIGDTGLITDKTTIKSYDDFLDYEAGIVILNNKDDIEDINSAYLTFKAGYQNKTHKHYDDLSITYFNFGHDILIDSGKYSYNQADSIRKSIISPDGHSMVSVKDKLYTMVDPLKDQNSMKLTRYHEEKRYKLVVGVNNLYPSVSITRHTVLTSDDILFVVDYISAQSEETILQNFNITPEATVNKIDNLSYRLEIDGNAYIIKSFPTSSLEIKSDVLDNYYSEVFSKVSKNKRIVFEVTGEDVKIITVIYREDLNVINEVELKDNQLSFKNNSEYKKVIL